MVLSVEAKKHSNEYWEVYTDCARESTGINVKDSAEDWLIQADGGVGSNGLAFYDLGRTSYRMIIDEQGDVGIGTTAPAFTNGGTSFLTRDPPETIVCLPIFTN